MNVMSRLLSGFFVCSALLLTLTSLSVDWLIEVYAPIDQSGNYFSLFEAQRKSEQLTREIAISLERIRSKEKVVDALLNGEMTLFEAAASFRSLHQDARTWYDPRCAPPAFDDGESWCRQVINWAELQLRHGHSASLAIAERECLEAELQEEMDCDGKVSLPD